MREIVRGNKVISVINLTYYGYGPHCCHDIFSYPCRYQFFFLIGPRIYQPAAKQVSLGTNADPAAFCGHAPLYPYPEKKPGP